MGAIKVLCPDCKELVETLVPCPLCGFTQKPEPQNRPTLDSLEDITRWTVRLLLFQALAGLFSFSITMGEALETKDFLQTLQHNDPAAMIPDCFLGLVWLVATILWLVWQFRLRVNYDLLSVRGMAHSPAWNVIWWFIPVANWFMPYLVLQELWRAGEAQAPEAGPRIAWRKAPACPLIRAYWIINIATIASALLSAFIVFILAATMRTGGTEMESLMNAYLCILMLTGIGQLLARFMEVFVVERLTNRQRALQERLWGPRST